MAFIGPDVILRNPAYLHDTVHLYGRVTVEERASAACRLVGHLATGCANKSDGFLCQTRRAPQR